MKKLAIMLISLMTAFTSYGPAQAFPVAVVSTQAGTTDVQQVRHRSNHRHFRRHERRHDRWSNDRRYHRRHHRNNAGAVIGGLAAGAIIGGAIASQNRGSGSCAARYRSYRASDHTYQPNTGPRRVCR